MKGNDILDNLVFDDDAGNLLFKDVRYMLIRPETLCATQKRLEERFGAQCAEILYESGFTGGKLSSHRYKTLFHLSEKEIVEFMCRMGAQIGWGKFCLDHIDLPKNEISVVVRNSPFAVAYGPSSVAVCHMIRGIVGGIAEGIFEESVSVKESLCLAKGDPFCRFEATPLNPAGKKL
jgi:predicted hydrocarbon binding protein